MVDTSQLLSATWTLSTLPSQAVQMRGVYALRNRVSGKMYVGSSEHVTRRLRAHISKLRRGIHHSHRLQGAWQKHGEAAFEFQLIELVPSGELGPREDAAFFFFRPAYNIADVSAANPMLGRKHTPESIEKMRQNRKGKGRGRRPAFTQEHRRAISEAAKRRIPVRGVKRSPEACKRIADGQKALNRRRGPAGHPHARPVEINGIVYATGKAAAKAHGIAHGTLIERIKRGSARYAGSDAPITAEFGYRHPIGGAHQNARAVLVGDRRFASCAEAARAFGINSATFVYWLHRGKAAYADGSPAPAMKYRYRSA